MEARASFGRTGISKGFIAVVAVLITLGLAVAAAAVTKSVSGSSATTQTHAVVKAQAPSYAQSVKAQPTSIQQPGYRGGKVTLDDGTAPSSTAAPRAPQPRGGHGPVE